VEEGLAPICTCGIEGGGGIMNSYLWNVFRPSYMSKKLQATCEEMSEMKADES
jgi:hypothetical protein